MPRGFETVNISRAATLTNLFYLFFHGGKSAVAPFLTLFFRLIGLSASQVGIIIAAKTVTGLVWAPLWSRCASAYNRQRLILLFSLFMMIITNLSFPALYTQLAQPEHCNQSYGGRPQDSSTQTPGNDKMLQPPHATTTVVQKPLTITTVAQNSTLSSTPSMTTTTTPANAVINSSLSPAVTTESEDGKTMKHVFPTYSPGMEALYESAISKLESIHITPSQIMKANLSTSDMFDIVKGALPEVVSKFNITADLIGKLYNMLLEREGSSEVNSNDVASSGLSEDDKSHQRQKRSEWMNYDHIRSKLVSIQSSLQSDKTLLCLVVLTIVVAGEIFASPVEKVADDSWFDFLNRIDDLERYGQQRFWGSFAFVVVPIIVTISVDQSPCFLPYHLHHFLLHFYILAILLTAALIISCCYPVPPPASSKYTSKIGKALRVVCCDGYGFLFSLTLLFGGMAYASFHNFLFWRIQDMGGSESTMGLCVSAAAFAEIPMLIFSTRLVKKLGNGWSVSLALLVLSGRLACFALIPIPWAIIPVEFSHGFTHTMLWFAILSYDDFNVGASIDRSIRSILSSFYFGVGFSVGSVVSGFVYQAHGSQTLYLGVSIFTVAWCVLYSLIQKCLPQKEKVRYIKLLRTDSDNSDENDDDDWLEMALKEK